MAKSPPTEFNAAILLEKTGSLAPRGDEFQENLSPTERMLLRRALDRFEARGDTEREYERLLRVMLDDAGAPDEKLRLAIRKAEIDIYVENGWDIDQLAGFYPDILISDNKAACGYRFVGEGGAK